MAPQRLAGPWQADRDPSTAALPRIREAKSSLRMTALRGLQVKILVTSRACLEGRDPDAFRSGATEGDVADSG